MASQQLSLSAVTALLIIIAFFVIRRLRSSQKPQAAKSSSRLEPKSSFVKPTILGKTLASALPDNVILQHDTTAFQQSMDAHWAQQEREVVPACVVRPRDAQQLSTAVMILKGEYDEQVRQAGEGTAKGLFAVRGGGHSPVAGAASISGGVVIDLGLVREVIPSEDGSSVTIGAGAKWGDVSAVLDEKSLAVVGGRNSAVGVGGLTLGGEYLFFTRVLANSLFDRKLDSPPIP